MQKILVTGGRGQLGTAVTRCLADDFDCVAKSSAEFDLTEAEQCIARLDEVMPDVVVNCAAYTAVDKAEEDAERAFKVNAEAPAMLAKWCAEHDKFLLHVSTDYVFAGDKPLFEAYREDEATSPLSVYGQSKLLGEQNIEAAMTDRYAILRTAWLYGSEGSNFLKTMLRIAPLSATKEIKVVDDQFGSPTSADSLARQIRAVIEARAEGVFHATSHGYCSWFDLADAFLAQLGVEHQFKRCSTAQYPTAAKRPTNSILANYRLASLGLDVFTDWSDELALFVAQYGERLLAESTQR